MTLPVLRDFVEFVCVCVCVCAQVLSHVYLQFHGL